MPNRVHDPRNPGWSRHSRKKDGVPGLKVRQSPYGKDIFGGTSERRHDRFRFMVGQVGTADRACGPGSNRKRFGITQLRSRFAINGERAMIEGHFIPDRPDGDWLNRQLALSVSKAINQSPSKAPRSCVSAGLLLEQRQTSSLFKLADAKSRLQCSSTPPTPKMAGATQDSTLSFSIPIKLRPCRCVSVRAPV